MEWKKPSFHIHFSPSPVRSAFSMLLRIGCFLGLLLLCFPDVGLSLFYFYFFGYGGYFYSLDLQMFEFFSFQKNIIISVIFSPPPLPPFAIIYRKKKRKKKVHIRANTTKRHSYKRKQRLLFVPMPFSGVGTGISFHNNSLFFFSKNSYHPKYNGC